MKSFFYAALLSTSLIPLSATPTLAHPEATEKVATSHTAVVVSDEVLSRRIDSLQGEFPWTFNQMVKANIKAYTERRQRACEIILERSQMYFNTFDYTFSAYRIPTEMKYLAVIESALDPKALSPVGARGLWQFMAPTAKRYGLRINKMVDERSDPYMSTQAAAEYLADLYNRYHDWGLAIAAYNCGPGRVDKVLKEGANVDYWDVQQFLPEETRNYVPAFIAAAYMVTYHDQHGIFPKEMESNLVATIPIKIYKELTFKEIADVMGISIEVVRTLNPSYINGIVPANSNDAYIIAVPTRHYEKFLSAYPESRIMDYAPAPRALDSEPTMAAAKVIPTYRQVQTSYIVAKGDNVQKIADKFQTHPDNVRTWNKLFNDQLTVGQELVMFESRRIMPDGDLAEVSFEQTQHTTKVETLPQEPTADTAVPTPKAEVEMAAPAPKPEAPAYRIEYYEVKINEPLWRIAQQKNVALADLLLWNGLDARSPVHQGKRLKIQRPL